MFAMPLMNFLVVVDTALVVLLMGLVKARLTKPTTEDVRWNKYMRKTYGID
jgi:hypothetical protein